MTYQTSRLRRDLAPPDDPTILVQMVDVATKKEAENRRWLSGAFWSNGNRGCTT